MTHKYPIRLLSLFSGIGAFEKALERLAIDYELVKYCEIDKHASKAYSLIHGEPESKNLGDITKVDTSKLKDIDLLTYGFPCVDISVQGKQKGFEDEHGNITRSGLFFEAMRIINDTKPAYTICENVKNLVSKRFKDEFEVVLSSLEKAGYNNYWKVLNAKDFGIPQNRERIFIISIRKDIDDFSFAFPQSKPLEIRLKDILEDDVQRKFYVEKSFNIDNPNYGKPFEIPMLIGGVGVKNFGKQYRQGNRIYDSNAVAMCLSAQPVGNAGGNSYLYAVEEPFIVASRGRYNKDGKIEQHLEPNLDGISNTLTTVQKDNYVAEPNDSVFSIRKLTPKECFRLMGFDDRDIDILVANGISNTQLYKMAGNSIVVDVLEAIFKSLFLESHQNNDLLSLMYAE